MTSAATTAARVTRRQVEALRGELGPDQHIDAAVAEVVVDRLEAAAGGERVGVEPRDPQRREAGAELRLDPLRPGAEVADPVAPAVRAALGGRGGPPAVVAAQRSAGEVIDEREVAVRAAEALAAVAAEDERRRAATIDDQHRLLGPAPQGSRAPRSGLTRRSTDSRRPARRAGRSARSPAPRRPGARRAAPARHGRRGRWPRSPGRASRTRGPAARRPARRGAGRPSARRSVAFGRTCIPRRAPRRRRSATARAARRPRSVSR